MKTPLRFALLVSALMVAATAFAEEKTTVAQLGFMSGLWRGTSSSGAQAEELISKPEGGVMLSAGREFENGKCTFYDLVVFTEKDGVVTLIPHPMGRKSADVFPLVKFEGAVNRATFENLKHDFPKTFVYELVTPDHLRITLSGDQKGKPATEVYDLKLVK